MAFTVDDSKKEKMIENGGSTRERDDKENKAKQKTEKRNR